MKVITQTCRVCLVEKNRELDFSRKELKRRTVCRQCDSIRRKARYQANREQEIASRMFYKRTNRDKISVINARYYRNRKARLAVLNQTKTTEPVA